MQAKKELDDCLRMNPGGNTCFALHNLACAQWLHVRRFKDTNPNTLNEELADEFKVATTDFIECIPNFQRSVQLFEAFPDIFTVDSELNCKNKLTGLSLTNLAEIYLEKNELEVIDMQESIKWLKIALKFYEENDKPNIGRALALIGTILKYKKNNLHAEGLLRKAIDVLKSVIFI